LPFFFFFGRGKAAPLLVFFRKAAPPGPSPLAPSPRNFQIRGPAPDFLRRFRGIVKKIAGGSRRQFPFASAGNFSAGKGVAPGAPTRKCPPRLAKETPLGPPPPQGPKRPFFFLFLSRFFFFSRNFFPARSARGPKDTLPGRRTRLSNPEKQREEEKRTPPFGHPSARTQSPPQKPTVPRPWKNFPPPPPPPIHKVSGRGGYPGAPGAGNYVQKNGPRNTAGGWEVPQKGGWVQFSVLFFCGNPRAPPPGV